jgi:hypothetical protein
MVGDGDAVRIAGEIVQNMFRTSEGWLDVDHPVFAEEESQERVESAGLSKTMERLSSLHAKRVAAIGATWFKRSSGKTVPRGRASLISSAVGDMKSFSM